MIRLLARLTLTILSNAVGLIAASALLDGFNLNGTSFFIALLIFSGLMVILGPLVMSIALKHISALMGGIALVTILISLILTDIFSDGMSISGLSTWVLATLIIWIFSLIGNVLLPLIIFKKTFKAIKAS